MSFYEADVSFPRINGNKYSEKRKIISLQQACASVGMTQFRDIAGNIVTVDYMPGYYLDADGVVYSSRVSNNPMKVRALSCSTHGTSEAYFNLTDFISTRFKVAQTTFEDILKKYNQQLSSNPSVLLGPDEAAYYVTEDVLDSAVSNFVDSLADDSVHPSNLPRYAEDDEKFLYVVINRRTGKYRVSDVKINVSTTVECIPRKD